VISRRAIEITRREVQPELYDAFPADLDPVSRRVCAARRVRSSELKASLGSILPVGSLTGAQAAAEILADSFDRQPSLTVVGDFDADGATSTALMVSCLRAFGYERVNYLVPNRFSFGYGLSLGVAELAMQSKPDFIITVDNGITSVAGVARVTELGARVIITDHHLPGLVLPAAAAIVNPNLPGETFPSKSLAGVGVAFYVMAALARELSRRGVGPEERMTRAVAECLDLVALGTVADMVQLDSNNRVLVAEGLRRIRGRRCRLGLEALFAVAGRNPSSARASDLGFSIAPRLNAAGRLQDMSLGIECLLCSEMDDARVLAARLDTLNEERKQLQTRMTAEAGGQLRALDLQSGTGREAHCLFDAGWHEGIVGLVAGRVREVTGRPAIALARSEEAGMLKGSARSIDGIHIRDVLERIAPRVSGLHFGGHAMAAGVRLPVSSLETFRELFLAEIGLMLHGVTGDEVLWTDGPLNPDDLRADLAEQLQFLLPWGQGLPEPLFDNQFEICDQRILKDAHLKLQVRHVGGVQRIDAIAFNRAEPLGGTARLLYRLDVNDYGGRRRPQLVVEQVLSD
jgi:single-stranded-DNA-specific exonuclease